MSISIDNNNGIINVSQDGNLAKSYFGVSGKFYPSGTSGALPYGLGYLTGYCEVLSDTMDGSGSADNVPSFSNSGTGATFSMNVFGIGTLTVFAIDNYAGTGYALGDTITIQGSDVAPGITGQLILKINKVETDGLLIYIDRDCYEEKWYNLVINGTSPTSLSNAQSLLSQALAPTPPITNPTLKVNPLTPNIFDIEGQNQFEDGNFTIEWLQYMHTDNDFPRVYSIGQYPAQNAVSIEGGTLYLWLNGSIAGSYDLSTLSSGYLDVWLHIVVTRRGNSIYVWAGYSDNSYTQLMTINDGSAIPTNGLDFYIGSENAPNTYYNGLISNFRWCANELNAAIYGTSSPTYPTSLLYPFNSARLLIGQGTTLANQIADQTGKNTTTNTGCKYNSGSGISGYNGSLQFGTI